MTDAREWLDGIIDRYGSLEAYIRLQCFHAGRGDKVAQEIAELFANDDRYRPVVLDFLKNPKLPHSQPKGTRQARGDSTRAAVALLPVGRELVESSIIKDQYQYQKDDWAAAIVSAFLREDEGINRTL
jgi:hypothetical protein